MFVFVSCYSTVLLTARHTHRLFSRLTLLSVDRKASSHLNLCVCGYTNVCETDIQTHLLLQILLYLNLTHCGRVTQICVFILQLCKTDDANLRF